MHAVFRIFLSQHLCRWRIDVLYLDYPFAGSRMLRDLLHGEGVVIGWELARTMMRRMYIEVLYRRPNTSKHAAGYKIYPYLLRGLTINGPTGLVHGYY